MRQPLTREAIAQAARDILVAEGLHAVSLRRVAAMLGVTAPALYAHVADKRDLLQGIVEREIDVLIERFRAVGGSNSIERLEGMSLSYIDYGMQNPDLFRAMFLFRPELTSEGRAGEPALGCKVHDAFADEVRAAKKSGDLEAGNADLTALTLWTTAHGVVTTLLTGPTMNSGVRSKLAESAVKTMLTGLRHGSLIHAA